MAEMLIVLAVAAILAGASVLVITTLRKDLKIRQNDSIAREICLAAQNNLNALVAVDADYISQLINDPEKNGTAIDEEPSDYYITGKEYAPGDLKLLDLSKRSDTEDPECELLAAMLPYGSYDEDALNAGRGYIEYDPAAYAVYAVWYTDSKEPVSYSDIVSGTSGGGEVSAQNGAGLRSDLQSRTHTNAQWSARRNYKIDGRSVILGYYSQNTSALTAESLQAPVISSVSNAETLSVTVTDTNNTQNMQKTRIYLTVEGLKSGAQAVFSPYTSNPDGSGVDKDTVISAVMQGNSTKYSANLTFNSTGEKYVYTFVLDSLLKSSSEGYAGAEEAGRNLHFSELCSSLIPGEDLKISAAAVPINTAALPARSEPVTVNSLFESVKKDGTVTVSHIRHLENLDPDISGVSEMDGADISLSDIEMTSDMVWGWPEGCDIEKLSDRVKAAADKSVINYLDEEITGLNGQSFDGFSKGSFQPVTNRLIRRFNGGGHIIYNMSVSKPALNGSDSLGLFGIFNPDGADGSSINGVGLVSWPFASSLLKDGSRLSIVSGCGKTGGIAGEAVSCDITDCFTSVIIDNKGSAGELYAGGIAGYISGERGCRISSCITAGFTSGGVYSKEEYNIRLNSSASEGKAAAGMIAGGVAADSSLEISGSFSTASVGAQASSAQVSLNGLYGTGNVSVISSYGFAPVLKGSQAVGTVFGTYTTDAITGSTSGFSSQDVYDRSLYGSSYPYINTTDLDHYYGDWGKTAVYEIDVFNPADEEKHFTITDVLPDGLEYVTDDSSGEHSYSGAKEQVIWQEDIPAKGEKKIILTCILKKSDPGPNYVLVESDGACEISEAARYGTAD